MLAAACGRRLGFNMTSAGAGRFAGDRRSLALAVEESRESPADTAGTQEALDTRLASLIEESLDGFARSLTGMPNRRNGLPGGQSVELLDAGNGRRKKPWTGFRAFFLFRPFAYGGRAGDGIHLGAASRSRLPGGTLRGSAANARGEHAALACGLAPCT